MGFFSGTKAKVKIPPEVTRSLAALEKLAIEASTAQAPLQKTAALAKLEELSIQLSEQFARAGLPPELQIAISETIKTATTPVDVTKVPELKALIERTEEFGQREANRLAQSIQIRGGSGSTGGRNILGQKLQSIQSNILATLAPFASTLRAIKEQATVRLSGLSAQKTGLEVAKIGVAGEAGSLVRSIQQRINDALFQQQVETQNLRFGVAPSIFSNVIRGGTPLIRTTPAGPSELQKIGGVMRDITGVLSLGATLAPAAGSAFSGLSGFFGGGTPAPTGAVGDPALGGA